MSFHKRFLSEESIRSHAQNDFSSFETYMVNADAYIVNHGWASEIYTRFGEADKNKRKEIHKQIKNGKI